MVWRRPSPEEIEKYRKMTVAERAELTLKLTREALEKLEKRPPRVIDRVCDMIRRDNDLRNRNMLERIARTKNPSPPDSES